MDLPAEERVCRYFDIQDAGRELHNWLSCPQVEKEELFSYSHLILGHATSSVFFDSIYMNGLIPDYNHERSKDDGLTSDTESVYLLSRLDRLYLKRAVEKHGGQGIILAVKVPLARLLPDESAINENEMKLASKENQLYLSFQFGSCKHIGSISPSKIIAIVDCKGNEIGPVLE